MYKQSDIEKKLIQIFKTFVDKALIPQIKKLEGSLNEWNRFSTLLFSDNINYIDLQSYVDSLPIWDSRPNDKLLTFNKRTEA